MKKILISSMLVAVLVIFTGLASSQAEQVTLRFSDWHLTEDV